MKDRTKSNCDQSVRTFPTVAIVSMELTKQNVSFGQIGKYVSLVYYLVKTKLIVSRIVGNPFMFSKTNFTCST